MKKLDTYKKLGLTCDNLVFDYFFLIQLHR